ncbi:MAG TPA: RNA polymerase sigma factor RpoD, partial [Thermovirga lienii]|nr:RNA polymerase sigma factor RpoD [Thermovirga lienii]
MSQGDREHEKQGTEMTSKDVMQYIDSFKDLFHMGREKGFLTYEDIEKNLPPEVINAETLDNLYFNLMELGIDLVEEEKG